jgi:hypothetical protein
MTGCGAPAPPVIEDGIGGAGVLPKEGEVPPLWPPWALTEFAMNRTVAGGTSPTAVTLRPLLTVE